MPINLGEFLGKEITATLRDGSNITGKVEVNPEKVYYSGCPFFLAGFGYTGDGYYEGSQESTKDIVSIHEPSSCVNLREYVGKDVSVTYRDGKQGSGLIKFLDDSSYYPFIFSSGDRYHTYTEQGLVLMHSHTDRDIVSIRPMEKAKVKNNLNLEQYLCGRVRVTYRDGRQAEGRLGYSSEVTKEHWPFKFFPTDNCIRYGGTYTKDGRYCIGVDQNEKDIMAIEILDPVDGAEKGSAVEKMALALLPAIFTSLKSDSNLDHAIEAAIRGTFLAMFGDDVTGETLNHSVSVIKSRISLSLRQ